MNESFDRLSKVCLAFVQHYQVVFPGGTVKLWHRIIPAGAAAVTVVALASPAGAATPGDVQPAGEGSTTVLVNPAVVSTLVGLGVAPVAPGRLTPVGNTVRLSFPIAGDPHDGRVAHRGGLDFAHAGGHKVRITRFLVNTNTGYLTAATWVDGAWVGRVPVFRLGAAQPINGSLPHCTGIAAGLTLTKAAAGALGIPTAAGAFIGDACVQPTPES
jgi:hypothetical protein